MTTKPDFDAMARSMIIKHDLDLTSKDPDAYFVALTSALRTAYHAGMMRAADVAEALADKGVRSGSWDDGVSAWDAAQIIAAVTRTEADSVKE